MRDAFCNALIAHSARPNFVFLTGDLGFKALEPLRGAMGSRFINAGVAEQNMICVAAGLARAGVRAWAYSIAPFLYARPFEQIRNNIAMPRLPVVLVGNGGGYGYGVMGSTHHALEDYGVMLTLPNIRIFIPAFDADLAPIVKILMDSSFPAYLRLGLDELRADVPPYAPWRKLISGTHGTLLVAGPGVGGMVEAIRNLSPSKRPSLWLLSELPITDVPQEFLDDLGHSGHLLVAEEHVKTGGVGQMIVHYLVSASVPIPRFTHRYAVGYPSGLYGSQKFHRRESLLDPASIIAALA